MQSDAIDTDNTDNGTSVEPKVSTGGNSESRVGIRRVQLVQIAKETGQYEQGGEIRDFKFGEQLVGFYVISVLVLGDISDKNARQNCLRCLVRNAQN